MSPEALLLDAALRAPVSAAEEESNRQGLQAEREGIELCLLADGIIGLLACLFASVLRQSLK